MNKANIKKKQRQTGFSLLEILVALVIVSILSVLAVNRYTERSEEARQSAAKAEAKAIADAERSVEIDTGYYVTLRALDDEPGNGASIFDNGINQTKIENEAAVGGSFAIETDGFFIANANSFPYPHWKGPYMNYVTVETSNSQNVSSAYGSPKDPWGNPYRLFTPAQLTNPYTPPSNITETNYAGIFDRMAIVSYGKDGIAGSSSDPIPGHGDDIIYRF